jgi:hypothetical protein
MDERKRYQRMRVAQIHNDLCDRDLLALNGGDGHVVRDFDGNVIWTEREFLLDMKAELGVPKGVGGLPI